MPAMAAQPQQSQTTTKADSLGTLVWGSAAAVSRAANTALTVQPPTLRTVLPSPVAMPVPMRRERSPVSQI
jgi:hypothetical protein